MKIAIATDFFSPWVGGPATFIENFASYLSSNDHRVAVIAPSATGRPGIEQRAGFAVLRLATIPVPFGHRLRATARLAGARRALQALRPDVLQIHHPFPLSFAVLHAAAELGIPVVAVNHTIPECSLYSLRGLRGIYDLSVGAFRRYLVWFLGRADAVCTPSRTAADLLRAMGLRREVEVISNGIDVGRFTPANDRAAARRLLGLPDRPIILYTGRLDPEKDMQVWLRAAALATRHTDIHLVVGGEGTMRPALEQLAHRLGIADRITFPGYLPADRLPGLYHCADIYCITSAVELQSITTLEALASGLPVVAARAAALPELVHDGRNGYLARPGDVRGFAAALRRLIERPDEARHLGAQGRLLAEGHSLANTMRRHLELLERTAAGRLASPHPRSA